MSNIIPRPTQIHWDRPSADTLETPAPSPKPGLSKQLPCATSRGPGGEGQPRPGSPAHRSAATSSASAWGGGAAALIGHLRGRDRAASARHRVVREPWARQVLGSGLAG